MCSNDKRGVPFGNTPLIKAEGSYKPREACGVFAVSFTELTNVMNVVLSGLKALQHRGEDGCGIAYVVEGDNTTNQTLDTMKSSIKLHKSVGLVHNLRKSIFDDMNESREDDLEWSEVTLNTKSAISHVRYGTQGGNTLTYVQPFSDVEKTTAIAFNGQIEPGRFKSDTESLFNRFQLALKRMYELNEVESETNSGKECDLEFVSNLTFARDNEAFSAVGIHKSRIYAFRDCFGTRPLFIAQFKHFDRQGIAVASESCAFNHLDIIEVREVQPGSLIVIENGEVIKQYNLKTPPHRFCAFEALYFSREDSLYTSESYYEVRKNLGKMLALASREKDINVDLVIGVPQSGMPSALGYSRECGLPLEFGLLKNRYTGRSFIQSDDSKRKEMVEDKLQVQSSAVRGKRVIVVDDTIVRGHTMKHIVDLLRKAGALEVHVRIPAPPILSPCTKGVDTGRETKLPAADLLSNELELHIGADSLSFLSLDELKEVIGDGICTDCFIL